MSALLPLVALVAMILLSKACAVWMDRRLDAAYRQGEKHGFLDGRQSERRYHE